LVGSAFGASAVGVSVFGGSAVAVGSAAAGWVAASAKAQAVQIDNASSIARMMFVSFMLFTSVINGPLSAFSAQLSVFSARLSVFSIRFGRDQPRQKTEH
jgi:hypothetical protein